MSKANPNNKYESTYIKKKSINKHNRAYRRREWIASAERKGSGKGTKHLIRKCNNSLTETGLIDHDSSSKNGPIFKHWDHKQKPINKWQCRRCHHANAANDSRCNNCNASIKKQDPTKHYLYDQKKSRKKIAAPLNIIEKPKKKKRKRKKKCVKKSKNSDNFAQYWDTMKQHNDTTKSLMEKQRTNYTQCNFEIRVVDIVNDKAEIDKLLKLTKAKTFQIPIQLNTKHQKINNRLMILFIKRKDMFDYSDTDNIERLFSDKAYDLVKHIELLDIAKQKLREVVSKIPKLYELLSWHKHDLSKNMQLNFGQLIQLQTFEIAQRYQQMMKKNNVMKKYNYSHSIKTQLTFTLLEYDDNEWIEEKVECVYDKIYMFNVPMKVKYMILLSCFVEMNINNEEQSFYLEPGVNSENKIPIYFSEFNPKILVEDKLNNHRLFDGAKEIIHQIIDFPFWSEIDLDFHSMHEPIYEPLIYDLKTLLIEYIPFVDILKYVLFQYVGYDTVSYIVLNGHVMFPSDMKNVAITSKNKDEILDINLAEIHTKRYIL